MAHAYGQQNLLSRIFGAGSIYETLNARGAGGDDESSTGMPSDSISAQAPSHYDLTFRPFRDVLGRSKVHFPAHGGGGGGGGPDDDASSTVPESLLYEGMQGRATGEYTRELPPRPEETEQLAQQQVADEATERRRMRELGRAAMVSSRERALWKWANVDNLDNFLHDVYGYFLGNGIYSILLSRMLNLLTMAFVTGFAFYLGACVNYGKLRHSTKLSQIQEPRCIAKLSSPAATVLWLLTLFWFIKLFQYISDIRLLWDMHNFYYHLLDISETDMQTISWQEVSNRLMLLRDHNPTTSSSKPSAAYEVAKQRMDAHDIANRIMRKENYLVAMFNKEILDLSAPLPFMQGKPLLTRTLEWNLGLCVLQYVFDARGQIQPVFLKDTHRKLLIDGLRRRFLFAGIMNAIGAPFIIIYLVLLYFFRYFNEYHKNPAAIGSRTYTPYALWKFREFNELLHIFQKRINLSHACADRYVSQFPNDKTVQFARFVSFVAGSFAAVLALASVIDPDLFLGFEITHDRTVLFYLGLFGTLVAVSRSLVPAETLVFEPEDSLREVIELTHYCPTAWQGNLHSYDVKRDFCQLYDYKLVIFLQEIASVVLVPLILWFSLPKSSEKIVDFVRDFTVHVDGIGHVCSFAVFDFSRHGNARYGAPTRDAAAGQGMTERDLPAGIGAAAVRQQISTDGKMEKSFLNFKASNPTWQPDPAGSAFLATLQRQQQQQQQQQYAHTRASPASTTRRRNLADSYAPGVLRGHSAGRRLANTNAAGGGGGGGNLMDSMTGTQHGQRFGRIREEGPAVALDSGSGSGGGGSGGGGGMGHRISPQLYGHPTTNANGIGHVPLGESFVDPTARIHGDSARSPPPNGTAPTGAGAGVLGMMQRFYQEAGNKAVV